MTSETFSWRTNRRVVVHLWPAVPAQAKRAARTTRSTSALSSTKMALFPPSSNKLRPNRLCTVSATSLPTLVLPVKETKGIRTSFAMAIPTSAPPLTRLHMAPGKLFCSRTSAIILVVATLHRGVEGAPFQIRVFPRTNERALFQPYTATGKLNAEMTPTVPRGFHISRCMVRSLGRNDFSFHHSRESYGIVANVNILLHLTDSFG